MANKWSFLGLGMGRNVKVLCDIAYVIFSLWAVVVGQWKWET